MTKSQVTFLPPSNLLNFKLEILNLMYEHLWWWYNLILKIFWIFYLICLYLNEYMWFIYRTMDRGNCLGMIIIHIETMAFYNLWFPVWNLIWLHRMAIYQPNLMHSRRYNWQPLHNLLSSCLSLKMPYVRCKLPLSQIKFSL